MHNSYNASVLATSGSDYDFLSTTLTFLSGSIDSAENCTSLTVNSDDLVEPVEDFLVTLDLVTIGANLSLENSTSFMTIMDSNGKS